MERKKKSKRNMSNNERKHSFGTDMNKIILQIITGKEVDDKLINDPRHPLLAVKQAKLFVDDIIEHGNTIVQKYTNSSDTISCLYYYGILRGIDVHIFQNDLEHEITLGEAFEDWNRSFDYLDELCDGSELY